MKKKYTKSPILVFLLLILLMGGCQKEDYTLPVEFKLNFTIKNEPIQGGSITIDEISLGLNSINVSGYREQGDDVFLTRNIDRGRILVIKPTLNQTIEALDIPQGVYNPLTFSCIFQPDDEESDLIEDIHEWLEDFDEGEELEELQEDMGEIIEDYLDDLTPCIMVKGKFTHSGKTKHIVMVVNDPLTYKILATNKNGSMEVGLETGVTNTGNMQFDPSYWFSGITPVMLNNAFVGRIDDDEYIFLNKYINTPIYATIFNRIEESTTLIINE